MENRSAKLAWPTFSRLLRALLGVCVPACLAGPALADVVNLTNGDRLTGTVDSISGDNLVLDTEFADRVAWSPSWMTCLPAQETTSIQIWISSSSKAQ